MQTVRRISHRFARDSSGAASIEYGLIATLVAVGALVGMLALGGGISDSWDRTAQAVTDAMKGQ